MITLKHGKVVAFHCRACDCDFVEARSKVKDRGFFVSMDCPDCGNEVKTPENISGKGSERVARPEENTEILQSTGAGVGNGA